MGAFCRLWENGTHLRVGGWLNAVIPMLIVPYYSTIGGWVSEVSGGSIIRGRGAGTVAEDGYFSAISLLIPGRQNSGSLCLQHLVFAIILGGVENGVECDVQEL